MNINLITYILFLIVSSFSNDSRADIPPVRTVKTWPPGECFDLEADMQSKSNTISKTKAIEIAHKIIERDNVMITSREEPVVTTEGHCYVVTFLTEKKPYTLGSVFDLQVYIDSKAGNVLRLMISK